jgi:hypothetical protein
MDAIILLVLRHGCCADFSAYQLGGLGVFDIVRPWLRAQSWSRPAVELQTIAYAVERRLRGGRSAPQATCFGSPVGRNVIAMARSGSVGLFGDVPSA